MSRGDARVPYPLGISQSVNVASSSARTSAGVGEQTRVALIYSSVDAYYALGDATVTATTSSTFIPAGSEHFVLVRGGQRVAVIRDSEDGVMKVSEFAY